MRNILAAVRHTLGYSLWLRTPDLRWPHFICMLLHRHNQLREPEWQSGDSCLLSDPLWFKEWVRYRNERFSVCSRISPRMTSVSRFFFFCSLLRDFDWSDDLANEFFFLNITYVYWLHIPSLLPHLNCFSWTFAPPLRAFLFCDSFQPIPAWFG